MLLSFHSYKGGTGKTTLVGNIGQYLAKGGHKVCLIDSDVNGPGLHSLFDLKFKNSMIEFLKGQCNIEDIIYKVDDDLELYLIPSIVCEEDISAFFNTPSDAKKKMLEIVNFVESEYGVEYVIFDSSPGINKSSLLVMNMSDKATVVCTIDRQDIRGAYVLVSMAKKLKTNVHLVFNKIPVDRSNEIDVAIEEFCGSLGAELLCILTYDEVVAKAWSRKLVISDDGGHGCEYCGQVVKLVEKLIN